MTTADSLGNLPICVGGSPHDGAMPKQTSGKNQRDAVEGERRQVGAQITSLVNKAKAGTLTGAEDGELMRLRRKHQALGRKLQGIDRKPTEFDPTALSRSRRSKSGRQGPAGGVTRIVSGGSPGLGKRG